MPANKFEEFLEIVELIQSVNISKIKNDQVKNEIVFYSQYVGVFRAIWFGYAQILQVLLEKLEDRLGTFAQEVQQHIDAHAEQLNSHDAHAIR